MSILSILKTFNRMIGDRFFAGVLLRRRSNVKPLYMGAL
jgi:hypothetical protein